ncbi:MULTISPECIES: hypothetical protein [Gammaproteobacteria]|uniref:hypothetical protein n=1 Tax=Gammaproteobacteria TaxID=1236 RepID=UPI002FC8B005
MAKVIILNAPPRSGKDTIQNMILSQRNVMPGMFKRTMFKLVKIIIGSSDFHKFMDVYETDGKDTEKLSFLGGMTCREFMIWISEGVIKPKFGNSHFGTLEASHLHENNEYEQPFIYSDGGFHDEVKTLVDFGHEVILVRLHREGFDFSNDSRDYIYFGGEYADRLEQHDINLVDGEPQLAVDEICEIAGLVSNTYKYGEDDIPW